MSQAQLREIIAEIMAQGATCLNCANEECYQNGRFCKESPGIPCENHVPETCATCAHIDPSFPRGNPPIMYHACLAGTCAQPTDMHNDACELYEPQEATR
jgi:hypothetical protein